MVIEPVDASIAIVAMPTSWSQNHLAIWAQLAGIIMHEQFIKAIWIHLVTFEISWVKQREYGGEQDAKSKKESSKAFKYVWPHESLNVRLDLHWQIRIHGKHQHIIGNESCPITSFLPEFMFERETFELVYELWNWGFRLFLEQIENFTFELVHLRGVVREIVYVFYWVEAVVVLDV